MATVGNARRDNLYLSTFASAGHGRPAAPWKMICWQAFSVNYQLLVRGLRFEKNSFLTSDAGMSLKTKERCGELDGKAGMHLKTKAVSSTMRECC